MEIASVTGIAELATNQMSRQIAEEAQIRLINIARDNQNQAADQLIGMVDDAAVPAPNGALGQNVDLMA